jgi:hypothetical protein
VDDELGVIGVNSVQSRRWKAGRLSRKQLAHLTDLFHQLDDALLKIVVIHHNVVFSPVTKREKDPHRRLHNLAQLIRCGVDMICLGHDHRTFVTGLPVSDELQYKSLLVQAGTAVSKRTRGEANSYNIITKDTNRVTITVKSFDSWKFLPKMVFTFEERERRKWVTSESQ